LICSRWAAPALLVAVTLLLLNCGGGPTIVATPSITSIIPDSIVAGSANFVINVTGENFSASPASVVLWNGSPRSTVFNSLTSQLAVTILASDVTNPGVGLISVMNPAQGGTTPTPASFAIVPLIKGAATITSLDPSSAKPGTKGPLLLTVNGTGFDATSIIRWNGTYRQPATVTSTALTTNLSTNDLAAAGIASVSVDNTLPGGAIASSVSVDFTIGSGMVATPEESSVNVLGGPANGRRAVLEISAEGSLAAFYSLVSANP
jgi:trimeric autotransporter adhesin